jgi:putative peptidoglycan lipid II flippase
MLKSILTNSTITMLSRVLGFIRDVMTARFLGAGLVSDCFFIAFKTPNFFRRLFAEGAFNAAFVPMFSKTLEGEPDPELAKLKAKEFAEEILAILLLALAGVFALFEIFMPLAMYVMAPGFIHDPERFGLAVDLTRTTFCYMVFISLVSLYSGILNAFMRFAVTAAAPILLNICMIIAMVGFATATRTAGHALAWSVAAAGVVQLIWVASAAGRMGMGLKLRWPKFSKDVTAFAKLIAPAALGAGGIQLNLMMDNILASFLPKGSISFLYYADRINQLPVGVIGVAVGTVLLPFLSRQVASGNEKAAVYSLNRAMELVMLLTLPAAAAFVSVAVPIITVLFHGERSHADRLHAHGLFRGPAGLCAGQDPDPRLLRAPRHQDAGALRDDLPGDQFLPERDPDAEPDAVRHRPCRSCALHRDRRLDQCRASCGHPPQARPFRSRHSAQAALARRDRSLRGDGRRLDRRPPFARALFPTAPPRKGFGPRAAGRRRHRRVLRGRQASRGL